MEQQENQEQQQYSPEFLNQWVKEQFQRANKHLAENGVLFESVVTEESRYMAPFLAMWKIKAADKQSYWVVSGDLPCDFMPADAEKTPREAIRHFSMAWQMRAEGILQTKNIDQTQQDYAKLLISRAEAMYDLQANDRFWQNEPA